MALNFLLFHSSPSSGSFQLQLLLSLEDIFLKVFPKISQASPVVKNIVRMQRDLYYRKNRLYPPEDDENEPRVKCQLRKECGQRRVLLATFVSHLHDKHNMSVLRGGSHLFTVDPNVLQQYKKEHLFIVQLFLYRRQFFALVFQQDADRKKVCIMMVNIWCVPNTRFKYKVELTGPQHVRTSVGPVRVLDETKLSYDAGDRISLFRSSIPKFFTVDGKMHFKVVLMDTSLPEPYKWVNVSALPEPRLKRGFRVTEFLRRDGPTSLCNVHKKTSLEEEGEDDGFHMTEEEKNKMLERKKEREEQVKKQRPPMTEMYELFCTLHEAHFGVGVEEEEEDGEEMENICICDSYFN